MKKFLHLLLLAAASLSLVPAMQSCGDDGYSLGSFTTPQWATVRMHGASFYFDSDAWGTLWPVNTDLYWYKPVDGQRVITSFTPLADNFEGFDHAVKVLTLQDVLTKQVETLTTDNDSLLGRDSLLILQGDVGISGGYMNLVFQQNLPLGTKHRISLVHAEADSLTYDAEGYVNLELRYNDYDDLTGRYQPAAVSFNLNSLDITPDTRGIRLRFNSVVNGAVTLDFDFASAGMDGEAIRNADFSQMQLE